MDCFWIEKFLDLIFFDNNNNNYNNHNQNFNGFWHNWNKPSFENFENPPKFGRMVYTLEIEKYFFSYISN